MINQLTKGSKAPDFKGVDQEGKTINHFNPLMFIILVGGLATFPFPVLHLTPPELIISNTIQAGQIMELTIAIVEIERFKL